MTKKLPEKLEALRKPDGTLPSFAWPGGYPMYYADDKGNAICPDCANKPEEQENLVAGEVNWEDANLYCGCCNKRIEAACGDDEELI